MNVEADQLTNEIFEAFSPENGVHLVWENLKFPMINLLANFAENFSKRKLEASEMKQNGERTKFVIFFKGMNRPFQLGILAPMHGYGFFYECFFSIGCFNASVLTLTWHLSILAVKKVALRE